MNAVRPVGRPDPIGSPDLVADMLAAVISDLGPDIRWASLTRRNPGRAPYTVAASDPSAAVIDALQYASGDGPSLYAIATGTITVSDFGTEARWPAFIARATRDTAVRAALSYPLSADARLSLNLYSGTPHAFDGPLAAPTAIAAAVTALALTAPAPQVTTRRRPFAAVRVIGPNSLPRCPPTDPGRKPRCRRRWPRRR